MLYVEKFYKFIFEKHNDEKAKSGNNWEFQVKSITIIKKITKLQRTNSDFLTPLSLEPDFPD